MKMKRTMHALFSTNAFLSKHSLSLQKYALSISPAYPSPISSSLQIRHFHRRKPPIPEIESDNKLKGIVGINNNLVNCKIGGWKGNVEALKNDKARFSKLHEDANVKSVGLQLLSSQVFENDKVGFSEFDENANVKRWRIITEESIGLEPLCSEIVAYFAERMISRDTLRRNGIMQKAGSEEVAIAFPYRRNGVLVSCKYWKFHHKRYWQEKETEKILYGVEDIRDTDDIIIVDGEIDKLSMEEAGFPNCVSVPNGAPSKISKTVPSEEKDKKFQYLWNCKKYLATNANKPGQALAEELACRLGRERCWRVKWPKKKGNEICKDANEVLMHLGPRALHEVINQA